MPGHALREALVEMERAIETVGEEVKQRGVSPAEFINIVGPIDEHPAPDHDGQHGEIDPVKPADGGGMLGLELLQESVSFLSEYRLEWAKSYGPLLDDEGGGCADPFEVAVVIDAHHFSTAHANDGGHGAKIVQPDVHDADFGFRCAEGSVDQRGEVDALLQDVL